MTVQTAPHFPLPASDDDPAWGDWVSATRTKNWLEDDPLLDWLRLYGRDAGFAPDDERPGFDLRTDMQHFVLAKGIEFESRVVELLHRELAPHQLETIRIAEGPQHARDLAKAEATAQAIRNGIPLIEQAVLFDTHHGTYGVADLLVRSDILNLLIPDTLSPAEEHLASPDLGAPWHYRVVDIKFRTLDLRTDGSGGADLVKYAAQVWIYNQALSRILGMAPPAAYLLGRSWTQRDERGESCLERLARIDLDGPIKSGGELISTATLDAVAWVRRLRREGASWRPLPTPSVPELYPHARNTQDAPWHAAKAEIAAALHELTLLPGMNPQLRRDAHARGIRGWDDPRASSATLSVSRTPARTDAVIGVNRDTPHLVVTPSRITRADPAWRTPAAAEFFVDFETVSNMNDDFSCLPRINGQPLIFQVGCGWLEDGAWQFRQWTTDHLAEADEARILGEWVGFLQSHLAARGLTLADARLYHWSAAETSFLETAYNSARARHPAASWPDLPWYDLLVKVVREEPVAVAGAFGFGLKPIASGMHRAGLIETTWTDGPADGLGAMIGAWWCDDEARRTGVGMTELDLMREIGAYNQVDCRSMAEVLSWLRMNR